MILFSKYTLYNFNFQVNADDPAIHLLLAMITGTSMEAIQTQMLEIQFIPEFEWLPLAIGCKECFPALTHRITGWSRYCSSMGD